MTEIKLSIEKPVNYWDAELLEYRDLALVWIVSMERIKPHSGFIYIWVDALKGEVVGGDQTR